MEDQRNIPQENQVPQLISRPAPQAGKLEGLQRYLAGALTAAAIISEANPTLAEDNKKTPAHDAKPAQIARIGSPPVQDADSVVKPKEKQPGKPHESHLKHHTIKLGAIGSIDKHPSFGSEVTWSYMPNLDDTKKLHLTITPIDFFAAQHHLHYEGKGEANGGIITEPKYFIGSMVGATYMINHHLELEAEIGGGATAIPYYKKFENSKFSDFSYQFAPVIKADLQLDFIVNPHFRTYIAYSPEYIPTPIPHAMKDGEIEKQSHLSHLIAIGVGTEF